MSRLDSRCREHAQPPRIGQVASAITEAGLARLAAQFGLGLGGGAGDGAAHAGGDVANLRPHRGLKIAVDGSADQVHRARRLRSSSSNRALIPARMPNASTTHAA
jgi:hypothetical protein